MVVPLTENATLDIRNTLHNNGIEQPIAPTEAPCLIVVGIQRYLQDSHFFSHVGLLEEFSTETTTPAVATPPTKLVTTGTSSRNNEETTSPTGGHAAAATPWWTVSPSSTTNNSTSSMIQQQIADCKTPAYDLLLSDGTYLLKCVLSPLLNGLVQYGWITLFTRIKLEKYEWRRNEWRIPVATILVVFQLSVQQVGGPMWMIDRSKLVFPDSADPCELKNSQPLAGRRLHYLSLNSEDSVPVDTQVSRKDILIDSLELFGSRSPQPLSKVLALYDNQKVVVVPLIGRVVKKFSCTHFGRRDSEQKFPIKFEFQLSDQHRLVHVVCWYTLYFRYFECIQLDDVVVLEGYRIRHQKEDHVEILLNPSNPQGKMYILDLKLVTSRNIRQWYPPCSLNLTDSSTLKNHPSSDVLYCDLVGRIHRLFPIHRYRPSHEYRFYERRWVLVRDSSSLFDIPILMYSCSQSKCFHVLQVGRPLLVTDCQLCRVGNNWEQNSFYLKTTFSSQLIYFEEQWEIVRKNHPEISFPQRFGEDEKEASELQYKECLSTYTRIRNYPDWLDSSRIDSWMEHLVTLEELQNRAKWLHLGECKTFLCQGKVKKVGWRYKKGYLPSQQVWEYPSYLPKYPQQQEEELAMDERFPVMKKKTTEYLEYLLDIISCDQKHRLTVVCTKSEVCRPYLDKKTMLRKASSHSRVLLEALDDVLLSRVLHGFASSAWETAAQVAENVAKCVKSETIIFEIEAMRWHPCTSIPPLSLAGVVFTLIGAYGDTVQVARQLLGKRLVRRFENSDTVLQGRIIEVEAYLGVQDRACHSYGGRRTLRTEPMFQAPGTTYIYFVYGMHYCFNISTGEPGEAVLIRALFPLEGIHVMSKWRRQSNLKNLCSGPAKVCQAFALDKRCNQWNLCTSNLLYIVHDDDWHDEEENRHIVATPRIGVAYAKLPWSEANLRFYTTCLQPYIRANKPPPP